MRVSTSLLLDMSRIGSVRNAGVVRRMRQEIEPADHGHDDVEQQDVRAEVLRGVQRGLGVRERAGVDPWARSSSTRYVPKPGSASNDERARRTSPSR